MANFPLPSRAFLAKQNSYDPLAHAARPPSAASEAQGAPVKLEMEILMSATEDYAASYANHQKALKEANAINKTAVFTALSEAKITRILADFDGEGDSGQLGNVTAYCGEALREMPNVNIALQRASWGSDKRETCPATLREAVEQLCFDCLEQEHGGWENNDGAFGEFAFDVAERRIELDFNARYSDSVHSSHSF
jgi:hypothetical protein